MLSEVVRLLVLVSAGGRKVVGEGLGGAAVDEGPAGLGPAEGFCRLSSSGYLPRRTFLSQACALCFSYTFNAEAHAHNIVPCQDGALVCPPNCTCPEAGGPEGVVPLNLDGFGPGRGLSRAFPAGLGRLLQISADFERHVGACCSAASECCEAQAVPNVSVHAGQLGGRCAEAWDGWDCFPATRPGDALAQTCPEYIYGGAPQTSSAIQRSELRSRKECRADGTWFHLPDGPEWTDYSGCNSHDEGKARLKLVVGVAAFSLSVLAIVPAILIFSLVPALGSASVAIHRQLLLSLLASSLLYIFNTLVFILPGGPGEHLVLTNHVFCRLMFTLQLRYFRLSNYMWMFCEGWYLHRLLVAAFEDQTRLGSYLGLGWAFPLLPTAVDSLLRGLYREQHCWVTPMTNSHLEWVHRAPCLLSLAVNFILMISIVVILVQKLQYSSTMEPAQYRKAVRGTLILLPMFGLHFMLTIYRAANLAYEILNVLLDGLQGLLVAVVICYSNHRVVEELGRKWSSHRVALEIRRESMHRMRSHAVASPSATSDWPSTNRASLHRPPRPSDQQHSSPGNHSPLSSQPSVPSPQPSLPLNSHRHSPNTNSYNTQPNTHKTSLTTDL